MMNCVNDTKFTTKNNMREIPIVFAVDDNYMPFLAVCLKSIFENSSKDNFYSIYVLNTGISQTNYERIMAYECNNVSVEFVDVTSRLDAIGGNLWLRDYYTKTIYYRFFIPALFPQYDKILYLDSDIVLLKDVTTLFDINLENNILAAAHEEVMSAVKVFGDYAENFLDVPCLHYFNSGVLLINACRFREEKIEEKFVSMLKLHKFVVAPDQDYLNVLCKNKVHYLDIGWNKTPIPEKKFDEADIKLVHYKMAYKPWHYDGVLYGNYFWKYAILTPYYDYLFNMKENYSEAEIEKDNLAYRNLLATAYKDTNSNYSYKRMKGSVVKNAASS